MCEKTVWDRLKNMRVREKIQIFQHGKLDLLSDQVYTDLNQ